MNMNEDFSIEKKSIVVKRVTKVTAGSKRLRFASMVVAGDRKGRVGIALGRGSDTKSAVEKASRKAEKTMKRIQLIGDTIPHEIQMKYGAAVIIMRPAKPGTGVIAGSSVRTVLELAGVENVYAKQLGTNDLIANAYCAYQALLSLRNKRVLARMKNMQGRIELKEKMDEERLKKDLKKRALKRKMKFDEKKGNRFGGRFNRNGKKFGDNKVAHDTTTKTPIKEVKEVPKKEKSKVEEDK